MRHRVKSRTLGRQTGHRLAMLRNMAKSLLQHGRISTTETRAKELAKYVAGLITDARRAHQVKDDKDKALSLKRNVFRHLPGAERRGVGRNDRDVAENLFATLAPKFAAREAKTGNGGGYTRILKLGFRKGDGAPMALIELVLD